MRGLTEESQIRTSRNAPVHRAYMDKRGPRWCRGPDGSPRI